MWYSLYRNIFAQSLPEGFHLEEHEEDGKHIYEVVDNQGTHVSRLVVQGNLGNEYYHLTKLIIYRPEHRGKGIASYMMRHMLNDSKLKDRPIVVAPFPYQDEPKNISELTQMYRHFGFDDMPGWTGWLIRK